MNQLLYRAGGNTMDADELAAAMLSFKCTSSRMDIENGAFVIGRYSVLPFYKELEQDLGYINARLINSYQQHCYVADLQNWVVDLQDLTPRTWDRLEMLPSDGPFVLKGQTNSKKAQWKTHMYATNRVEAMKVYGRLCDDGLIGDQKIYIRQFVPLVSYFDDVAGLPVTKEFRFFVYNGIVLCGAFYWSNYADEVEQKLGKIPSVDEVPFEFLSKIVHRIGTKIPFYALDIAETQSGEWTVIELNDGQMSGLSMNDPKLLYKHLAKLVAPQK